VDFLFELFSTPHTFPVLIGPAPLPLFEGLRIIVEGLGIKLGFDCEIDYCVTCKQSSFAFNGVREVINISKKQTETKDRVLRDTRWGQTQQTNLQVIIAGNSPMATRRIR
jgi:hypothetical protein